MRRKIVIVGAAALAVAGGGAALAASTGGPQDERKAVLDDVAKELGVTPARLTAALKKALENRVDAAVAAGRLTKEQGEALKKRIEAQDFLAIGGARLGPGPGPGRGFGHHGFGGMRGFGASGAAATYLGLSKDELRSQLADGKSLAEIAKSKGKSVDGLVTALLADTKTRLDAAVKAGRLTQAQADQMLQNAKKRLTDLVNAKPPAHPEGGKGATGKSWFGHAPGPLWSGRSHHQHAAI